MMTKIDKTLTESLGFWEVDFDEKLLPYKYHVPGWYMIRWSTNQKYLGISLPETDCCRMFECKSGDVFFKLHDYLDGLEVPDNRDQADDAVVELIHWLARNPDFTWKDSCQEEDETM